MTPLPHDLLVNGAKIFVMRLRQIGCRGHHAEWVKGNGGRGFPSEAIFHDGDAGDSDSTPNTNRDWSLMPNAKEYLLAGTILSAVVLGLAHAAPLDAAFVVAQAPPQSEQEDKKPPPQRPGQRQKQQEERQVQPPPTPGEQPPGRRQERQGGPPTTPGGQPPA